jgi:hypothetical protein
LQINWIDFLRTTVGREVKKNHFNPRVRYDDGNYIGNSRRNKSF